jgi:hypothetical protein
MATSGHLYCCLDQHGLAFETPALLLLTRARCWCIGRSTALEGGGAMVARVVASVNVGVVVVIATMQ